MSRIIDPKKTVLLVCDIQDRFRACRSSPDEQVDQVCSLLTQGSAIWNFDAVVTTSRKMVRAAKVGLRSVA